MTRIRSCNYLEPTTYFNLTDQHRARGGPPGLELVSVERERESASVEGNGEKNVFRLLDRNSGSHGSLGVE